MDTRPTILIVDDQPEVRNMLTAATSRWGYAPKTVASAEDAVRCIQADACPMILTDLRMAGKGGVWLVRQIHELAPDSGVIVLTGDHEGHLAVECLNAGAFRYFFKPVNLVELRHAIDQCHENYRLRIEKRRYQSDLERTVQRQTSLLRKTFLSAVNSLSITLEARDPYTAGHSLRVSRLAVRLGQQLELEPLRLKQLRVAARLHDIGKVGTPEWILHKSSGLTADEFNVIKQHPVIGERILSPIIRSRAVLSAIRNHHERYDGSGYPDGFSGNEIPELARIIAVADAYDAMVSSRAYRAALSREVAIDRIAGSQGSHFDPRVTEAFLAVPQIRRLERAMAG